MEMHVVRFLLLKMNGKFIWNVRYVFVAIVIFLSLSSQGQITFNTTIDFSNGDEVGQSLVIQDDGYILVGGGWGFEIGDYFDQKIKYAKINIYGETIWKQVLGDSGINMFCTARSAIKTIDGNIVFTGSRQAISLSYSQMHLLKFDPVSGDTIYYKVIEFDDHQYGEQVREFSNGDLLLLGEDSNDAFGPILQRVESDGEFIWEERFGSIIEDAPSDFEIYNDDTIYLVNSTKTGIPVGYHFRTIDSSGTVISETQSNLYSLSYGKKSTQNGFYGAGGYYPMPPYFTYVYRMDSNGELTWQYNSTYDLDTIEYGQFSLGPIKELPNGDMIVAGYFTSNEAGSYVGYVSKIDFNGISYWERTYTANEDIYDDNSILDVAVANDGGIILLGAAYGENDIEDQNFWVLKLDSMGCLIPGCDTIGDAIMELPYDKAGILVYPNPIKEEAIVQVTLQNIMLLDNLTLQVVDITGKLISNYSIENNNWTANGNKIRFSFQRNNIQQGIYLLSIYSDGVLLGSEKISLQ